jgi:hypothetical protein
MIPEAIDTIEFCAEQTIKQYVLKMRFDKIKPALSPPCDFKMSYGSFHGKKRAIKHVLMISIFWFLGGFLTFQIHNVSIDNKNKETDIEKQELEIKTNPHLKQKKDFALNFVKKEWGKIEPLASHIHELEFITSKGFYCTEVTISSSRNIKLTLQPITGENNILSQFLELEKSFKNIKACVVVHKPPHGLERGRKKPCSKAKIEITWGQK